MQERQGNKWTFSDRLAVALACLTAVMALGLIWMERTPAWAGATVVSMALLMVYPVIHFVHSNKGRLVALMAIWGFIGFFGWKIWPKKEQAVVNARPENQAQPQPQLGTETPAIKQESKDSPCSNIVAGGRVDIKCPPPEKDNGKKNRH